LTRSFAQEEDGTEGVRKQGVKGKGGETLRRNGARSAAGKKKGQAPVGVCPLLCDGVRLVDGEGEGCARSNAGCDRVSSRDGHGVSPLGNLVRCRCDATAATHRSAKDAQQQQAAHDVQPHRAASPRSDEEEAQERRESDGDDGTRPRSS